MRGEAADVDDHELRLVPQRQWSVRCVQSAVRARLFNLVRRPLRGYTTHPSSLVWLRLRAVAYNALMGTPRRPRLERRNTVNTLESSRFKVVLDKVCNGRLDRCTVDSVRPGKTATRAAYTATPW